MWVSLALSCGIDYLYEAHAIVDNELFSIGILYCWIVCLIDSLEDDTSYVEDQTSPLLNDGDEDRSRLLRKGWQLSELVRRTDEAVERELRAR